MVYYVCPNCGNRSAEYSESMVHYNACDVVRVRTVNSPPGSTVGFSGGSGTGPAGGARGTEGTGSSTASSAGSATPASKEGGEGHAKQE